MAFDVLSFVMGQQAGKASGGSSGGNMQFKGSAAQLTGTAGERININFGFQPDLLIIQPSEVTFINDSSFMWYGISQSLADALGTNPSQTRILYSSSKKKVKSESNMTPIEYKTDYKYGDLIYNTDETGFNIGAASGSFSSGFVAIKAYKFT